MRLTALSLSLLMTLSSTGFAKTPDGATPSEEVVCDDYDGKAFGICNALCEAMDCDSDSPNASERACEVKETQFTKLTGDDMPACEADDPGPVCDEDFIAECEAAGGSYGVGPDGCTCVGE